MGKSGMIDEKRLLDEFRELVSVDSVSFRERKMADLLKGKLADLGFAVWEDDAGSRTGGNAGNLYGYLQGTLPGVPILLSAHMDTVQPGNGKSAQFREDGRITSSEDTVLGADDAAGLAEILEGIRSLREAGIPHRDVEVLFSAAEEAYCKGIAAADLSCIRSKEAYVLDLSGPVGGAALQAPSIISFQVTVKGRASHAGFEPEKGIHAVTLMCRAVAEIRQGHLDQDTTRNIGEISGGVATNIVPEQCVCRGEVRSYDHDRALAAVEEIDRIFAETLEGTGAEYDLQTEIHMKAYKVEKDEPVVRRFLAACEGLGLPGNISSTFGGSDNNHFTAHGIRGIVIACGMQQVHSTREYIRQEDLALGAELIRRLITSDTAVADGAEQI